MSRWAFWVIAALFVAGLVVAGLREGKQGTLVKEGAPSPTFDLERFEGGRVRLADLKGQLVVLDFWATWCPPCREEMPWLVELAKKYEGRGVTFVAVSEDDPDIAKAEITRYAAQVPGLTKYVAYSQEGLGPRFQVQALPTLYIIGADGKIIAGRRGQTTESFVRDTIEEHLPK